MRRLECDDVVVGAGPAGSLAARTAAEKGTKVILLEEHPEVGRPIFCAEGLSLNGIKDAGVEPEPSIVCPEISKARVYAPDMNFVELTSSDWRGFTLNREVFDRALSENAVKAGAELMTSTRVTDVIKDDGTVTGVKAISKGEPLQVRAQFIIVYTRAKIHTI